MTRKIKSRALAALAVATIAISFTGCGDEQRYDIGRVLPIAGNECEDYAGTAEGEGAERSCWVTRSECKRAANDWGEAARESGGNDTLIIQEEISLCS